MRENGAHMTRSVHLRALQFSNFGATFTARIWSAVWVSLIINRSECLICYFLCTELTLFCTELTLFCTELPENCIYLNQSELSNFSMYIINYSNCTDPRQHGTYWYFFKGAKKCWGRLCVCPPPYHDMVSWITPAKTCRRNSTYHVKYYYLHRQ